MTHAPPTAAVNRGATWVPFALVVFLAFPVTAGTLRLIEIFGGPENLPAKPRITQSPAPAVIHIVSALLFVLLGAFQFSARIRRRHPRWHQRAGRVVLLAG